MAFSYLSNDVVGQQVIPAVIQGILDTDQDPSDGGKYYTTDPSGTGGLYGDLQDEVAAQPTFNDSAAVYTPTTETGTSVEVDNTNGLNPNATVTLTYAAETGATASTETSNSVTAGVTQEVDVGFDDVAESKTTFSFSGTLSYSQGTSTSTSSTVTNSVEVPVTVPTGKVYEATVSYTQETLYVPYTLQVYVPDAIPQGSSYEGVNSNATFAEPVNGGAKLYGYPPSYLFNLVQQYNAAGQDSDLYSAGTAPNVSLSAPYNGAGVVTLDGTATMLNYGSATTEIYDVTPSSGSTAAADETSQPVAAAAPIDESAGIGALLSPGDGSKSLLPAAVLDALRSLGDGSKSLSPAAVVDALRSLGDGGKSLLPAVVDALSSLGDSGKSLSPATVVSTLLSLDDSGKFLSPATVVSALAAFRSLDDGGKSLLPAAVDENAGVGVHRKLGDGGESFRGSKFNDWVEGGAGNDHIYLNDGGNDRASGGGGDDLIEALGGGRNTLDGGDGNDHLTVVSDQPFNNLSGGAGDDLIAAYAPKRILTGGPGDDVFVLDARSAGSVILDAEGHDKLEFASPGPIALERSGANLFIHASSNLGSFDPEADIAWLNFFSGDGEVNGLSSADLAATLAKGATPVYTPDTGTWSAVSGAAALASIFDKGTTPVHAPDTGA